MSTETNAPVKKDYTKQSRAKEIWKRFRKNKTAMVALVILLIIIVSACTADLFYDYQKDACQPVIKERLQKPSSAHILGTDEFGRDMLCRIIYGGRASLIVGICATTFALIVGGALGMIGGYYGGKLDSIIMRCTDVLLAIPGLLLAIAIMSAFENNVFYLSLSLGLSYISKFTRIVRSSFLTVREQEYVEAARAIGAKDSRIMIKHVLMNCLAPIFVQYALAIGSRILSVSTLSYIGMGIQPPTPDWGNMLSSARAYIRGNAYLVLGPGLALLLTIASFNLIGDGLRDALDPKLKK